MNIVDYGLLTRWAVRKAERTGKSLKVIYHTRRLLLERMPLFIERERQWEEAS